MAAKKSVKYFKIGGSGSDKMPDMVCESVSCNFRLFVCLCVSQTCQKSHKPGLCTIFRALVLFLAQHTVFYCY